MAEQICTVVDGALSPAECRAVINAAEARGFLDASPAYPPTYRDNDRQLLDDPALAERLFARLRRFLPETLDGEQLVGLNTRFRICRYQDHQQFTVHQDGAWHPDPRTRSRLTLMLYLNDDSTFSGGHTRFYERPRGAVWKDIAPQAGRLMLFDHLLWHDGAPVHSGQKYILRTDVLYRAAQPVDGHLGYVWAVAALPDGRIATGGRDQTARIWREGACELVLRGHDLSVLALCVDEEGRLVTGSRDGTIATWDLDTGAMLDRWEAHGGAVLCLSSLGGEVWSGGADGVVRSWPGGEVIRRHEGWVRALSAGFSGGEDGVVLGGGKRWEAGAPVWSLLARDGEVYAGMADGTIAEQGSQRRWQAHDAGVRALCWHGGRLVSGGEDAVVCSGAARWPAGGFVSGLASTPGGLWCAGYSGLCRL